MVKKDDIETQHAPAVDDIVVRRGNDKQQSRRDNDKNKNKNNTMTNKYRKLSGDWRNRFGE